MGVVFKAEDIKLKRTVALKFLAPYLTRDTEAKKRFIREAQTLSLLDHPNICTVYEIEETEEGQIFIAMAYYEGESLQKKIRYYPLKLEQAIDIGMQVCQGLLKAHSLGVTHRDINPANIIITTDATVKIVDFGLAQLTGQSKLTGTGTTMGTAFYMAPEQARGAKVDHRSDIWALGVVLYESITGQLPFIGDYHQAVIYSILNEEPKSISTISSNLPPGLAQSIHNCLEKDPEYRCQTAQDLLAELKRIKRDLPGGSIFRPVEPVAKIPGRFDRFKKWSIPVVVVIGFFVILATFFFTSKMAKISTRQQMITLMPFVSDGSLAVFPSWSPDGTWIAYASDHDGNVDIWKKPIDGGEAVQLTESLYNENQPAWSPDGRTIAFSSDQDGGGIFLIPAKGGIPWRLTPFGANPAWSPDNETLAFDWNGNIYTVPCTGGDCRTVISGTSAIPYVAWMPAGNKLIFWNRTRGDIYLASVDGKNLESLELVPSGEEVAGLSISRDGKKLVYSKGPFGGIKDLWQVAINPHTGKTTGPPSAICITTTEDIHCALSPDGSRLAFIVRQLERHLWALPIDLDNGLAQGEPKRITTKGKLNYYPFVSPDGQKVVWTSHQAGHGLLYSIHLKNRIEKKVTSEWGHNTREAAGSFSPDGEQVTFSSTVGGSYQLWRVPSFGSVGLRLTKTQHPTRDVGPMWAPDGSAIAFYSNRSGTWDIWSLQVNGSNNDLKQLTQWHSNELYPSWSPDSRYLAFRTDTEGNPDIWIMAADGSNPSPFVTHPAEEAWSSWSPQGRWFYFISNRDGSFNLWVQGTDNDKPEQVTHYHGLSFGFSESALLTKFAVSSTHLILPLETRQGDIYLLEGIR